MHTKRGNDVAKMHAQFILNLNCDINQFTKSSLGIRTVIIADNVTQNINMHLRVNAKYYSVEELN